MPVSAHDVARELRARLPGSGDVKIHKLLYLCQGWHLGWTGRPLFREEIEAWANGPVVADFWRDEKYGRPTALPRDLDPFDRGTIAWVVNRYGHLSGKDLIRLTHGQDPWRDVAEDDAFNSRISHKALVAFFAPASELVAAMNQAKVDPAVNERLRAADARLGGSRDDSSEVVRRLADRRAVG